MSTQKVVYKNETYQIKDGPSVDKLFDACKYWGTSLIIPLQFKIADCELVKDGVYTILASRDFRIRSISHGVDRADLILEGSVEADLNSRLGKDFSVYVEYDFTALYNVKTRRGEITFKVPVIERTATGGGT